MIISRTKRQSRGGREVSWDEGNDFARKLGCEYVEACAKTRVNVEKAFYVVRELRKQRAASSNKPQAMLGISGASTRSRAMPAISE